MTPRRRPIPFEEWTRGDHGYILACEECFWSVNAGGKDASGRRSVPVYKTEAWADAHAERFHHTLRPVQWFRDETARLGF